MSHGMLILQIIFPYMDYPMILFLRDIFLIYDLQNLNEMFFLSHYPFSKKAIRCLARVVVSEYFVLKPFDLWWANVATMVQNYC